MGLEKWFCTSLRFRKRLKLCEIGIEIAGFGVILALLDQQIIVFLLEYRKYFWRVELTLSLSTH